MDMLEQQRKAGEKIARYGSAMVLRLVTGEERFDPATGRMVEHVRDLPVHGLRTRPESREFAGVEAGDVLVLVSAAELVLEREGKPDQIRPDTASRLLMEGEEWTVAEVRPVQPGDVPVLVKLLVRRA